MMPARAAILRDAAIVPQLLASCCAVAGIVTPLFSIAEAGIASFRWYLLCSQASQLA